MTRKIGIKVVILKEMSMRKLEVRSTRRMAGSRLVWGRLRHTTALRVEASHHCYRWSGVPT